MPEQRRRRNPCFFPGGKNKVLVCWGTEGFFQGQTAGHRGEGVPNEKASSTIPWEKGEHIRREKKGGGVTGKKQPRQRGEPYLKNIQQKRKKISNSVEKPWPPRGWGFDVQRKKGKRNPCQKGKKKRQQMSRVMGGKEKKPEKLFLCTFNNRKTLLPEKEKKGKKIREVRKKGPAAGLQPRPE